MLYLLLAFLAGALSGLRAFLSVVAIAWAARFGRLSLDGTKLAFLTHSVTAYIFTALGLVELVTDQLPSTPSRKVPKQFIPRLLLGGLSGAAIGLASGSFVSGVIAGFVGAVVGTFSGAKLRATLADAFHSDMPAAFLEDGLAIVLALVIVWAL